MQIAIDATALSQRFGGIGHTEPLLSRIDERSRYAPYGRRLLYDYRRIGPNAPAIARCRCCAGALPGSSPVPTPLRATWCGVPEEKVDVVYLNLTAPRAVHGAADA